MDLPIYLDLIVCRNASLFIWFRIKVKGESQYQNFSKINLLNYIKWMSILSCYALESSYAFKLCLTFTGIIQTYWPTLKIEKPCLLQDLHSKQELIEIT